MTESKTLFLDFIRAGSGLVVFVSHFFQIFTLPVFGRTWLIGSLVDISYYAVLVFFILSGFLIAKSVCSNIKKNRLFDNINFFVKRVARIYPPLITSVLVVVIIYYIIDIFQLHGRYDYLLSSDILSPARNRFDFSMSEIASTLMQVYAFGPGEYLDVNGALWSLSYEVGFYALIGIIATLFTHPGKSKTLLLASLVLILIGAMVIYYEKYLFVHYFILWLMGVWGYMVYKKVIKSIRIGLGIMMVLISMLLLNNFSYHTISDFIFCLASVYFIYFSKFEFLNKFKLVKFISKLSASTYTLYLIHFPTMLFVLSLTHQLSQKDKLLYFMSSFGLSCLIIPLSVFISIKIEDHNRVSNFIFMLIKKR